MNKKEVTNEFKNLVKKDELDIFSIEDLMMNNIENYKNQLIKHIEELLQEQIDEGKIILKKNKNGKIVDIISITKEKKN